jgi:lysosomal acid lipase/cholesteryl ester hydrolase/gastric triacylglycerol lipase
MLLLLQTIRRGRDQQQLLMFDWGMDCSRELDGRPACNQARYGQLTPPVYNLSAITTPLGLFTGGAQHT